MTYINSDLDIIVMQEGQRSSLQIQLEACYSGRIPTQHKASITGSRAHSPVCIQRRWRGREQEGLWVEPDVVPEMLSQQDGLLGNTATSTSKRSWKTLLS